MKIAHTGTRRQFLLGAGAASVAAVATVAAVRETPPAAVKVSKPGVPAGLGYQVSDHVRNYYRTTAV